ncbi:MULTISPECIES: RdgB/HAM1 family non-canonical purine NTP pyrophosphatase [Aphanothece]|uniref:RdgB/HAM1 family non-canonical purine NTP pyrophosphatase n=1 Tax=Aphanothece TaxID=1121 RepID=UPI00398EE1F3
MCSAHPQPSPAQPSPAQPSAGPSVLVIASGNAGKVREFSELLARLGLELHPQPEGLEVEESGRTFAENARLKAEAVARRTGCWALADDSGLSVDALGGAPGVHSARYGDSDAGRIARLLRELDAAVQAAASRGEPADRSAHFTAALAVADPTGTIRLEVEGVCPGTILPSPRGAGGFGYDPVFHVPAVGLSFAEMDRQTKQRIGHRGRAFAALEPRLRQLLRS